MKTYKEFVSDMNESVKVSKSSEEYYSNTHGHKPKGTGSWAFSTVHPQQHDTRKHDTHIVHTSTYADAKKKAIAHYKEKGHTGEIHTLT